MPIIREERFTPDGTRLETIEKDTDADEIRVTDADDNVTTQPLDPAEKAAILAADAEEQRRQRLAAAIATAEQWAEDARGTNVTAVNAVNVLQQVVDRLGVFFDYFADELREQGRDR